MKKLFLVFAAAAISFGANAQADSIKRIMSPPDINDNTNDGLNLRHTNDSLKQNQDSTKNLIQKLNDNSYENRKGRESGREISYNSTSVPQTPVEKIKDCVMMKNGKMMMSKNGVITTMDPDMLMTNGTRVMSDGRIYVRDGIQSKMREGQYMDMSGNMMTMLNDGSKKAVNKTQNKPLIRN